MSSLEYEYKDSNQIIGHSGRRGKTTIYDRQFDATRLFSNVAAVALAHKTARIAWAMLQNETDYDPNLAVG